MWQEARQWWWLCYLQQMTKYGPKVLLGPWTLCHLTWIWAKLTIATPKACMHSWHQIASNTAPTLPRHPASLEVAASIFMTIASATTPCMGQVPALLLNPQLWSCPSTHVVLALWYTCNILNPWSHIITGLHYELDVGVQDQLLHIYLFYFDNHSSSNPDPAFINLYILSE